MADRKAVNKYYPPDWDPSKGSINKHNNSHPLRARARKIEDGILVVRFEMPFNVWCSSCDNHIAMGVRFNAEKKKVGNYYTTPIYKFKMKCRHCPTSFVIQTDPGKFDYAILSGARRQVRTTECDDNNDGDHGGDSLGHMSISDEAETKKRMTDAMYRLEKKVEDQIKSESQLPTLQDLKKWRSRWKDNFTANQIVRSQFRQRRKQIEKAKERDKNLLKKTSLDISLATPSTSDTRKAKEMLNQFAQTRSRTQDERRKTELLVSKEFLAPRVKVKIEKGPSTSNNA